MNLGNYSSEVGKLSLEGTQTSDIQLRNLDKETLFSVQLDTSLNSGSVDLNLNSPVSGESLSSAVAGIQKEVVKESKVNEVDKKLNKTLEAELKKLENQSSLFQSGYEKVETYNSKSQGSSKRGRTRRSVDFQTSKVASPLTQEERVSIQKHLEVFNKLNAEKKGLFKKLEEATEESSSPTTSPADFKKMLDALKTMKWNGDKLLLKKELPASPSRRKPRAVPEQPNRGNLYGWQSWDTSPWSPFFETQDKWLGMMDKLQGSEKALKDYLASRVWCGAALIIFNASHVCVPERDKLAKRISDNEEEITLHIASKILTSISSSSSQLFE